MLRSILASPSTSTTTPSHSTTMSSPSRRSPFPTTTLLTTLLLALILSVSFQPTNAVKFDLQALPLPGNTRCLAQFLPKDTLIVGTITIGPGYNQRVDVEVKDDSEHENSYYKKFNVEESTKFSFTTHEYTNIYFCFTNSLYEGVTTNPSYQRSIQLHIDSGAEAVDYSKIAENEKLKPLEVEIRRMEGVIEDIVSELDYLKAREMRMRDTNESTNDRVKFFSMLSIATLIACGAWQVLYLRKFFQTKKLI